MAMEFNGEDVPGNLVKVMRYFIKGALAHTQGPSEGTEQIATLLREGWIKRSRFPSGLQLLLGGVGCRKRTFSDTFITQTPCRRLPSVVDSLTESVQDVGLSSPEVSSDEDKGQEVHGINCLSNAIDLA